MISGSQISLINPTEPLSVGDTVYVGIGEDRIGTVAFIGETQFATGEWIGVILSSPNGKNDGSVSGVSYFKCKPMHGIFSKRHNIRLAKDSADKLASGECATESAVGFSPGNDIPTDSNCPKTSMDAVAAPAHISSDSSCFQVGDRVQVSGGRTGVLRFLGPTEFAAGEWAGIELDEPLGKNDGSVSGKRYFACKPNFGLFSLASKLHAPGTTVGLCTPQHRRSQESLVSYSSNLSSVSRSYRAQHGLSGNSASYGRTTTPNIRRPTSAMNSNPRGQQANIQSLQRLIKEKEDHISQLLQEREIERSDLARATLDREMAESEILNQRNQIERLNQQLQNMEAVHQLLQDECEQLTLRLHEEKKNLEDLQFRMEEENINKSTLEPRSADEDSRVFELEEALMSAREINEQTEAELARVQAELAALRTAQSNKTSVCPATEKSPLSVEKEHQKGDTQIPSSDDSDPQVRDAKVGSPSKLSLHRVNLVAQASVAPVQMNPDSSLQAECERLRRELADRERITESALKRQADVLEVVTDDFQKQIAELNAQVLASSKELVTSRQECSSIKEQSQVTITELQDEIHRMKCKFTEEESKYKETLSCYQKRIEGLTAQLDSMKGKTSATVMEQSVALRKLEEKLKFTERQLLDYQQSVLLSAQQAVHNQIEQVSELADDANPVLDKPALLEQLKQQRIAYEEQLERLKVLESERNSALETQHASVDRIHQLEGELSSIREELLSSGSKQEELKNQLNAVKETRDKVLAELSQLLSELPAVPGLSANSERDLAQELRVRIGLLEKHAAEAETHRDELKCQVQTLQHKRTELERELALLNASHSNQDKQQDLETVLEQLEVTRQKMHDMETRTSNALKELENKSVELQKMQKSLDETLQQRDQLQQAHQQTMAMLETERRHLQERIRVAESGEQVQPSSPNDQLSRLLEEKNGAESQVAFLNSIIVDLHEKNKELEDRVRSMLFLEDSVSRQVNPAVVNSRPPRRWCDHCLVFDSHETEDCPNKPDHVENGFKPRRKLSALVSQQPSSRIYCDICGVFDKHTTENCTDAQTF